MTFLRPCLGPCLCVLGLSTPLAAQETTVSTEVGLYGFGVAIGGDASLGPVTADIDLSAGDVLDALDGAFLGYVEHRRDAWLFLVRVEYMDLGFDADFARGPVTLRTGATLRQLTPQAFAGYRVQDTRRGTDRVSADLFAGVRHVDVDIDVDASLAAFGRDVDRGFESSITFTEPVLAARAKYTWNDAWGIAGWVDVGGFGIGSDYSAAVELTVDRQWENGWRVFGGWKYFTFEYTDDRAAGDLTFTPTYSGPVLGASYRF